MALALSTSWNASRHEEGRALLSEITALGFTQLELSFNLTRTIVEDITDAVRAGTIGVGSIHNVCPIPEGLTRSQALPDYYSMASTVETEREKAVFYAKRSIDTARAVGAAAVVLHCGRVSIGDRMPELIQLYERGMGESPEFRKVRGEMMRERELTRRPFFERVLRSLDELNRYALKQNIKLGVETRFYHREIPSFDEFAEIFTRFGGSQLGYWHDMGHAAVAESLGFCRHRDFLDAYGPGMLGVHIHDVDGCRDHKPPLSGKIRYEEIIPLLKPGIITVIEAHQPASAQEIARAKQYLEGLLNEHPRA